MSKLPSLLLLMMVGVFAVASRAQDSTAIVAKDGGLWPQLQVAHDGAVLAFGYNAAAHTTLPGDVDCWASTDGGVSWALRATAAKRPASHANYCHFATGLAANGDVLLLASGMDHAASTDGKRAPNDAVVFRSGDAGRTWKKHGTFPKHVGDNLKPYPFGGIVSAPDKSLRSLAYTVDEKHGNAESAWMFTSRDDGRTWGDARKVADGINESVAVPCGGTEWLCIARTRSRPAPQHGEELRQFRSADDGRTWTDEGLLTTHHQHPPHLLRLRDGRLVLTYCDRRDGGIETRVTADHGKTWTPVRRLFKTNQGDCGYPSTAEWKPGQLITVFYAQSSPLHSGYHMGSLAWQPTAK